MDAVFNEANYILRHLDNNTKEAINDYIKMASITTFVPANFEKQIEDFSQQTTMEEYMLLRSYTGYNYKNINALLRNRWTYDENGPLTEETRNRFYRDAEMISQLISRFPSNQDPFIVYRGTDIQEFSKYGITSNCELVKLKEKYLYNAAFTSTSIDKEESYHNKEVFGRQKDILIRYIIPSGFEDGMPLLEEKQSYSPNQKEFLLDKGMLSYVIDVKENELVVIVIPKKIWNKLTNTLQEEIGKGAK